MFILAIASLLALAEGRRHLCDDGTRPICSDGSKAVYNRPTGKNTGGSTYFPPPVCEGEGSPACADGSVARVRFNTCPKDLMKCPNGQGLGPNDKPFSPCADDSKCHCPGGGKGCQFHYKVCDNGQGVGSLTAPGLPRTATNTTGSEFIMQGIAGQATDHTSGDQELLATNNEDFWKM